MAEDARCRYASGVGSVLMPLSRLGCRAYRLRPGAGRTGRRRRRSDHGAALFRFRAVTGAVSRLCEKSHSEAKAKEESSARSVASTTPGELFAGPDERADKHL